ncbi:uncharacterized protein LOC144432978 [Glandiceps talaboti]
MPCDYIVISNANFINLQFQKQLSRYKVTGSADRKGKEFGFLEPRDHFVVPNIAHYIWFTCHQYNFINLVSMLSAHRTMKAEKIFFHTDCEPTGELWEEAKTLIPTLEIHNMSRPQMVFGKKLNPKWPEHSADVARLQVLSQWGGVYLDTDVFVLAPLEPLRYYDYAVGRASDIAVSNGIILANKNATFLQIFYESYKNYNAKCWGCSSVKKQNLLAKQYKHLLHIEPDSLIQPNPHNWDIIFRGQYNWNHGHFAMHIYIRFYNSRFKQKTVFNKETIKTLQNAFGEMCRYIYYGSAKLLE